MSIRAVIQRLHFMFRLAGLGDSLHDSSSLFFHDFRSIQKKTVIREEFIVDLSRDKRVIHFGFLDSPFSEDRIRSHNLLHEKIRSVAAFTYGIDVDIDALHLYRNLVGDMNNSILDIQTPLSLEQNASSLYQQYDLILFPEVLEHLMNPAQALLNLKTVCLMNSGAELCITVPNAFSWIGILAAISGTEMVHPGHYFYFSPHTLTKLLIDAGFKDVQVLLYSSQHFLETPGITKHGLVATCKV